MKLDHIAVAGATLQEATEAVETALGVSLQPGGKHELFGTHNSLLGLADGLYLEAIAADPDAPVPKRPRWFDLDKFSGPARLTNWICQTGDLEALLPRLHPDAGHPVALARGELTWQMAVPESGRLPFDNLYPALISWQGSLHPSAMLDVSGCRLRRLVVSHPDGADLADLLQPLIRDDRVDLETGEIGLAAEIDTPHGLRQL